jgi:sugar lactone lactonase YvrE
VVTEEIDIVVPGGAELGESPVWDDRAGCLWWVDIKRGILHRHEPTGAARGLAHPHGAPRAARGLAHPHGAPSAAHSLAHPHGAPGADAHRNIGEQVGAVVARQRGGVVLAVRSGVVVLDDLSGPPRRLADLRAPGVRFNDAKCDAAGRLWAGTVADDGRPGGGRLYRVQSDGRAEVALEGVTVSNGLDWSPDGRTLYYVDSATQRVDAIAFDPQTASLGERRALIAIAADEGIPDGLTVDAEGHLWLALFAGGAILRIAPDGSRERTVRLPVSHPTSCAFGGPDLTDLYITSAAKDLSPAERAAQPHAGAVLRIRPGVSGRAANRFAG